MKSKTYLLKNNSNKKIEDFTAIILTHNEERHIERCILSIKKFVKKIIIIDSYSSDKTIQICKKFKSDVQIYQSKFTNHSQQLNKGLARASIKTKWVLRIDSDEILESSFYKKFKMIKNIKEYNALSIMIEHNFLGNRIKYGGVYPQQQIRMWRKNQGKFDNKPVDEKIIMKKGKIYYSKLKIIDHNLKDFSFWLKKHKKYANNEANLYFMNKKNKITNKLDNKFQEKILYYKFPIFIRPCLLFFYRYIIKKGFLDGIVGIKFNIMHSLYYRFLIDYLILQKFFTFYKK